MQNVIMARDSVWKKMLEGDKTVIRATEMWHTAGVQWDAYKMCQKVSC